MWRPEELFQYRLERKPAAYIPECRSRQDCHRIVEAYLRFDGGPCPCVLRNAGPRAYPRGGKERYFRHGEICGAMETIHRPHFSPRASSALLAAPILRSCFTPA